MQTNTGAIAALIEQAKAHRPSHDTPAASTIAECYGEILECACRIEAIASELDRSEVAT